MDTNPFVQIAVRIDRETHQVLSKIAANEDRTLNRQVHRVLREWADTQIETGEVDLEP